MLFSDLLCYLDKEILPEVEKLLELKAVTSELGEGEKIVSFNDYIEKKILEIDEYIKTVETSKNSKWNELNDVFLSLVK